MPLPEQKEVEGGRHVAPVVLARQPYIFAIIGCSISASATGLADGRSRLSTASWTARAGAGALWEAR